MINFRPCCCCRIPPEFHVRYHVRVRSPPPLQTAGAVQQKSPSRCKQHQKSEQTTIFFPPLYTLSRTSWVVRRSYLSVLCNRHPISANAGYSCSRYIGMLSGSKCGRCWEVTVSTSEIKCFDNNLKFKHAHQDLGFNLVKNKHNIIF